MGALSDCGGGGGSYILRHVSPKHQRARSQNPVVAGLKDHVRLGLTSNLVFSAIILWNPIPTPSITARKHAHMIAEFRAAFIPPLIASAPPVRKPAITGPKIRYFLLPLTGTVASTSLRPFSPYPYITLRSQGN